MVTDRVITDIQGYEIYPHDPYGNIKGYTASFDIEPAQLEWAARSLLENTPHNIRIILGGYTAEAKGYVKGCRCKAGNPELITQITIMFIEYFKIL